MKTGAARHDFTRRCGRKKGMVVPEGIDPTLRVVMEAALASNLTWDQIAADAGMGVDTIRFWYRKRYGERTLSPSFHFVRAVAAAVGLELQWVPAPRRIAADGYALMDDDK